MPDDTISSWCRVRGGWSAETGNYLSRLEETDREACPLRSPMRLGAARLRRFVPCAQHTRSGSPATERGERAADGGGNGRRRVSAVVWSSLALRLLSRFLIRRHSRWRASLSFRVAGPTATRETGAVGVAGAPNGEYLSKVEGLIVKHAIFGLLCALALQGCAGSSQAPSTSSQASSSSAANARPTAAGWNAGGCQPLYGRVSPYGSCRDY